MTRQKALVLAACCALLELTGARLLDRLDFVEGLLAPNGARLLLLVPLSCVFYGARLVTYFALPALVVASFVFAIPRSPSR